MPSRRRSSSRRSPAPCARCARSTSSLRLRFEANKRAADAVLAALERHAHSTRSKYARIVPKQRTASGIVRPPTLFFDNIVSMGAAEKFYKQALEAANAKREAMMKVRTTSRDLQRHMDKIETALVVHELEVRKYYKTDEGKRELEADPRLEELAKQCEADRRRAARLRGPARRRRRSAMRNAATGRWRKTATAISTARCSGLHCLHERELRFGTLRYLMFRDASTASGSWSTRPTSCRSPRCASTSSSRTAVT